jgi:hypothetical protein
MEKLFCLSNLENLTIKKLINQQEIEQMDKKHTKFITALADLYKVIMKSESTKEVDFLLESLHEKGETIRKKDIGFWDINGNYKEDYQEITENDIR